MENFETVSFRDDALNVKQSRFLVCNLIMFIKQAVAVIHHVGGNVQSKTAYLNLICTSSLF